MSKTDTSEVFNSTWGLSESTWSSPITTTNSTKSTPIKKSGVSSALNTSQSTKQGSKVTLAKEGSKVTHDSKVTPTSKGTRNGVREVSSSSPSTRNDRRNKIRSSPPVTSTPVIEGSGLSFLDKDARDREGETITPVKPLVQNERETSSKSALASKREKEAKISKHLPEKTSSNINQVMDDCYSKDSIDTATIESSETATVVPGTIACDDPHHEDTPSLSKQNIDSTDGFPGNSDSTDGFPGNSAVTNTEMSVATTTHASTPVGKALEYVTQVSISSETNSDSITGTGQMKNSSEGTSSVCRSPENINDSLNTEAEVNVAGTALTKRATDQRESTQSLPRHQRESTDPQIEPDHTTSKTKNSKSPYDNGSDDELVNIPQTLQTGEDIVSNECTSPTRPVQSEIKETTMSDEPPSLTPVNETSTKANIKDNDFETGSSKDTIDSLKKVSLSDSIQCKEHSIK